MRVELRAWTPVVAVAGGVTRAFLGAQGVPTAGLQRRLVSLELLVDRLVDGRERIVVVPFVPFVPPVSGAELGAVVAATDAHAVCPRVRPPAARGPTLPPGLGALIEEGGGKLPRAGSLAAAGGDVVLLLLVPVLVVPAPPIGVIVPRWLLGLHPRQRGLVDALLHQRVRRSFSRDVHQDALHPAYDLCDDAEVDVADAHALPGLRGVLVPQLDQPILLYDPHPNPVRLLIRGVEDQLGVLAAHHALEVRPHDVPSRERVAERLRLRVHAGGRRGCIGRVVGGR